MTNAGIAWRRGIVLALGVVLALGLVSAAPVALAQDKAGAGVAVWEKLCGKAGIPSDDGKAPPQEKTVCLTLHERLDGGRDNVLISVGVRETEGDPKRHLMVTVPLGMALAPGLRLVVYTKPQWDKVARDAKLGEKSSIALDLGYSLCHPLGCTAETEASPDIVEAMKNGGGLMLLAVTPTASGIAFPVPLTGYAEALAAKPRAGEEGGRLTDRLRQRQADLVEQARRDRAEKARSAPAPAAGAKP